MDKFSLAAVALIVIGLIESVALFMGVNGTALATTIGVIAAMVGGVIGYGAGKKNSSPDEKK